MDYRWWSLLHIFGVAGFLAAHGVSMWVFMVVRRERDRARIEHYLQLSGSSLPAMYVCLAALGVGGILDAFTLHLWGLGWIWGSIALLVIASAVMGAISAPYYRRVKQAVKLRPSGVPRTSDEELDELLASAAPMLSAGIGLACLLGILYLMVWKPF